MTPEERTLAYRWSPAVICSQLALSISCFIGDLEGADCTQDSDCLEYLCIDRKCREPATVTAIAVGSRNTCAVVDGNVRCWGDNRDYQLGIPSPLAPSDQRCWPSPNGPEVSTELQVKSIAISNTNNTDYPIHACALHESGSITCWGKGSYAQTLSGWLGQGNNLDIYSPLEVSSIRDDMNIEIRASSVSVSEMYSCAILTGDGDLSCWGAATKHLGAPTSQNVGAGPPAPMQINVDFPLSVDQVAEVALGTNHACAIVADGGSTWCWGAVQYGGVGVSPCAEVQCDEEDFNPPFDEGPTVTAPVKALSMPTRSLAVGGTHTCAIRTDDTVYCWGSNKYGQLGLGTASPSALPPGSCRPDLDDGKTECTLVPIEAYEVSKLQVQPLSIVAGEHHSCILTSTREVYCWGDNRLGQLGTNSTSSSFRPLLVEFPHADVPEDLACAGAHCCVRTTDGGVLCWGDDSFGQLGRARDTGCVTSQPSGPIKVPIVKSVLSSN